MMYNIYRTCKFRSREGDKPGRGVAHAGTRLPIHKEASDHVIKLKGDSNEGVLVSHRLRIKLE
jgi:hypothetical protein